MLYVPYSLVGGSLGFPRQVLNTRYHSICFFYLPLLAIYCVELATASKTSQVICLEHSRLANACPAVNRESE
jgi:hypothetical protein